jgi:KAP family P-loop domain
VTNKAQTVQEHLDVLWKDDLLDRRAEADFLEKFLSNCVASSTNTHVRGSLVVNLKAQWGSGKSFFLKRFAQQLRKRGHLVAQFDAWRADPSIDPLISLVAAIRTEVLPQVDKNKNVADALEVIKESGGQIVGRFFQLAFLNAGKKIFGPQMDEEFSELVAEFSESNPVAPETMKQLAESAGSAAMKAAEEAKLAVPKTAYFERELKNVDKQRIAVDRFTESISKIASESVRKKASTRPFYIIVDELDRCRPTFAIEVLERINHLFDTDGIVFIIGTDSDELEHSICAVYGEQFNSSAYLNRFFDYTYHLSAPKTRKWIEYLIVRHHIDLTRYATPNNIDPVHLFAEIGEAAELRARDFIHVFFLMQTFQTNWPNATKIDLIFLYTSAIAVFLKQETYFRELKQSAEHHTSRLHSAFQKVSLANYSAHQNSPISLSVYLRRMDTEGKSTAKKLFDKTTGGQQDSVGQHIASLLRNQLTSLPNMDAASERPLWSRYEDLLKTAANIELPGS